MFVHSRFKRVDMAKSFGAFPVGTTAISKAIGGRECTVNVLAGNCWINPAGTAVADATSIKLTAGAAIDLSVASNLSLISDSTLASVQIIVWQD